MKSLIAVSTCLLALATAATASAKQVDVPYQTNTAMTEKYIYWLKRPGTKCKFCVNLYRLRISDGEKKLLIRARHSRLTDLFASGDTISYTVSTSKSSYRSEVWAIRDDGVKRRLATANYRNRARHNCGSMVTSHRGSQEGEVVWTVVTAASDSRSCAAPSGGLQRVRAAKINSATREVGPRMQFKDEAIYRFSDLAWMMPIVGFNGTRILFGGSAGELEIYDVASRKQVFYDPSGVEYVGDTAALSPDGAVALVRLSDEDEFQSFLYPNGVDNKRRKNITVAGGDLDLLRFCGSSLIQVSEQRGALFVIKRDPTGAEVSRSTLPFPERAAEPEFDCNATTGLIRYGNFDDEGYVSTTVAELIPL